MAAKENDHLLLSVGDFFEKRHQFNQVATEPEKPLESIEADTSQSENSSEEEQSISEGNPSSDSLDSVSKKQEGELPNSNNSHPNQSAIQKPNKDLPKTGEQNVFDLSVIGGLLILLVIMSFLWRKNDQSSSEG